MSSLRVILQNGQYRLVCEGNCYKLYANDLDAFNNTYWDEILDDDQKWNVLCAMVEQGESALARCRAREVAP